MTQPKACPTCPQPQPRGLEGQGGSEISWPPWSQSRKGIGWQAAGLAKPPGGHSEHSAFQTITLRPESRGESINLLERKAERQTP